MLLTVKAETHPKKKAKATHTQQWRFQEIPFLENMDNLSDLCSLQNSSGISLYTYSRQNDSGTPNLFHPEMSLNQHRRYHSKRYMIKRKPNRKGEIQKQKHEGRPQNAINFISHDCQPPIITDNIYYFQKELLDKVSTMLQLFSYYHWSPLSDLRENAILKKQI